MVHIITDSTADLGREFTEPFQVHTIPLYVNHNGDTYQDGVNISMPDLFKLVESSTTLPKTSAPTLLDFQMKFGLPGEIVYIGLSGRLSMTQQNALLARESCGEARIFVVDSRNLSAGIGLLVLKAADLRARGLSGSEIYQQVSEMVPKVRSSFLLETLDYLYKGGRCTAMQNLVGSLLRIRPVIAVQPDGSLGVKTKLRGTRQKALSSLLDDFRADLPNVDLERVFVAHTGCLADAEYVKAELQRMAPIQEVFVIPAGCVIASHCGPDTLGLFYLLK